MKEGRKGPRGDCECQGLGVGGGGEAAGGQSASTNGRSPPQEENHTRTADTSGGFNERVESGGGPYVPSKKAN